LADLDRSVRDVQRRLSERALGEGTVLRRLDERRGVGVGPVVLADPVDLDRADGGERDDAGAVAEVREVRPAAVAHHVPNAAGGAPPDQVGAGPAGRALW